MIGRVLTFVACVAVVLAAVPETCNNGQAATTAPQNSCCMPTSWDDQLVDVDTESYPAAVLDGDKSGFLAGTAGFRFTVKIPRQYADGASPLLGGGPALASATITIPVLGSGSTTTEDKTYTNLPNIQMARISTTGNGINGIINTGQVTASYRQDLTAAGGLKKYTAVGEECLSQLSVDFLFNSLTTTYSKTVTSGGYKYVYAAMHIIAATEIYGKTFKTLKQQRLIVDTMTYKFKFQTTVTVAATATVTYAAIDYSVVLTSSKVRAPTTADWTSLRGIKTAYSVDRHAICTVPSDTATSFCGNMTEIKLDVGVTTVTPNEYVTTLRTSVDASYVSTVTNPFPAKDGFRIRGKDFYSGVDWIKADVKTLREHGLNTQAEIATTLDGTPGIFNTDATKNTSGCQTASGGHCKQKYRLYLKYEFIQNPSATDYWTAAATATKIADQGYGAFDATTNLGDSEKCQLKGVVIHVGNGNNLTVGPNGSSELHCRNTLTIDLGYAADTHAYTLTLLDHGVATTTFQTSRSFTTGGTVFSADNSCPFTTDGGDIEDNISAEIKITTADWCPALAIDNGLTTDMTTSKTTFFADEQITVFAHAKASGASGLAPTQLVWKELYGKCPATATAECNVLGGNSGSLASPAHLYLMFNYGEVGTHAHNVEPVGASGLPTGSKFMDLNLEFTANPASGGTNCLTSGVTLPSGWSATGTCSVQASFYLCEHSDAMAASTSCGGTATDAAFDIDNASSSTGLTFAAVLSVGFPSVNAATSKKTTRVEYSPGKEVLYALLQSQSEETEVAIDVGFGPRPTAVEESVEQPEAETGASNPVVEEAAAVEESNSMLIYIIVGVFLFISVFVGALVMYLRRSKNDKKVHPVPITVEVNKSTAAMA